jgi:hypothetical protein
MRFFLMFTYAVCSKLIYLSILLAVGSVILLELLQIIYL